MRLPTREDIADRRISLFKRKLTETLASQELARLRGIVGARDEDDEDAAVLRRDVAELEVLDVDARRSECLRDAREDAWASCQRAVESGLCLR